MKEKVIETYIPHTTQNNWAECPSVVFQKVIMKIFRDLLIKIMNKGKLVKKRKKITFWLSWNPGKKG